MLCKKPITTFKIKEQAEQEKMRNFIKYLFNENSLFDWFILYFKNYQNNEGFLHKEHVDLARRRGQKCPKIVPAIYEFSPTKLKERWKYCIKIIKL